LSRLQRASQHIADFETELGRIEALAEPLFEWSEEQSAMICTFRTPNYAEHSPLLGCIAGDALHNMRVCLNYLVSALVALNGVDLKRSHEFPICLTEEEFRSAAGTSTKPTRCLDGIRRGFDIVEGWQPFQRGAGRVHNEVDILASLRRLSNSDKHIATIQVLPVYWPEGEFFAPGAQSVELEFVRPSARGWAYEDDSRVIKLKVDQRPDHAYFTGSVKATALMRAVPREGETDKEWAHEILQMIWDRVHQLVLEVAQLFDGVDTEDIERWIRQRPALGAV
jgi:hypothetical protein